MKNSSSNSVAVVGAGIVGLCIAYYLQKAGLRAVLIDRSLPGTGCSFGNSGALSENSVTPIGMPGIAWKAPRMLMDPRSPLKIRPGYVPQAAPWLRSFVRSANERRVIEIADSLAGLLHGSSHAHHAILEDIGAIELLSDGGQLHAYPDEASLAKDALSWRLREARGLIGKRVDRQEMRELEPALSDRYRAGMFLPTQKWVKDPYQYCRRLFATLSERGGQFVHGTVTGLDRSGEGWTVRVDGHTDVGCANVIVATGVNAPGLLEPWGTRLPLISQRGYHVHLLSPNVKVNRIIALADRKAFVTPMGDGLRIGGTVEIDDPDASPTERRATFLADDVASAVTGVNVRHATRWMGNRPCSPDSMPFIGTSDRHPGLWYAAGHGHLGLTGSANTGALIAGSLLSGQVDPRLAPFSADRRI
ncbi:NAD(P)/FAD-dependent oxidoreductase [Burkholderia sp. JKS000303]|uniref:NAD(P)/FAD-dependent oxidoreductase n=1 Tax=Burkholderia sp. JKS000303 TaxID=1938747 RepID=UPI000C019FF6|nr:FAD-dependent oxidoreductase [Burkholderia sp. JKS000303]PFH28943.1 D-amino-acid dehydrogenase [Burkholderia sp. JKS000303]